MIEIVPNWHPIFVHFTVALLTTSVIFFVLAGMLKAHKWHGQWLNVAHWNLWLGVLFSIATGVAGWLAYNSVSHDTPSHVAMTDHRNWAIATLSLFFPLGLWSIWRYRANKGPVLVFILPMLVAVGLLMSTAWRGGEIVYRYGLGVMSMPKADDHGLGDTHSETGVNSHSSKPVSARVAKKPGNTMKRSGQKPISHRHEQGREHNH